MYQSYSQKKKIVSELVPVDHLVHLLPAAYVVQAQLYGPYRTMQGPLASEQVQVLPFFFNSHFSFNDFKLLEF